VATLAKLSTNIIVSTTLRTLKKPKLKPYF